MTGPTFSLYGFAVYSHRSVIQGILWSALHTVISQCELLFAIFLFHYAYFSAGCTLWRQQKHTTKSVGWEPGIVRSYRLHLPCRKSIYRLRKRAILQQHLAQKYTSEIRSRSNIIYRISTIQPSSDTLTLKEAFIKIGTLRAPHHRLKFRVSNKRSKLCHLFKLVSHFSSSLTYVKRRGIAQKLWFTSPCRELYNARTGIRAFCNESQHMLRCNNNLRFIEQHARNSSHDASHRRCARPKTDWGEGLEWLRIHQAGIWRTMSS